MNKIKYLQRTFGMIQKLFKKNEQIRLISKYVFFVRSKEIIKDCFVPRYYWNTKIEKAKIKAKKMNMYLIALGELLEKNILVFYQGHGSPQSRYKGRGNTPYIRVADIVNWEIYKNPTSLGLRPNGNLMRFINLLKE